MLCLLLKVACGAEPSYSLFIPLFINACPVLTSFLPHDFWHFNTPMVLPNTEDVFPGLMSEVIAQGVLAKDCQTGTLVTD